MLTECQHWLVRGWNATFTRGARVSGFPTHFQNYIQAWYIYLKNAYEWLFMMTSSNGNIFRVTGPLCGEFTGHRWIPLTKASDAELWRFLWSAPWINGWANNHKPGDLRRHRTHYDVIVVYFFRHCPQCNHAIHLSIFLRVVSHAQGYSCDWLFNPILAKFFTGNMKQIYNLYNFSTLTWHRWLTSFLN